MGAKCDAYMLERIYVSIHLSGGRGLSRLLLLLAAEGMFGGKYRGGWGRGGGYLVFSIQGGVPSGQVTKISTQERSKFAVRYGVV